MTEISKLPRRERAKRYREMAWAARGQAAHSKGDMKTAFIKIAEQWEQLALEAEADDDESET